MVLSRSIRLLAVLPARVTNLFRTIRNCPLGQVRYRFLVPDQREGPRVHERTILREISGLNGWDLRENKKMECRASRLPSLRAEDEHQQDGWLRDSPCKGQSGFAPNRLRACFWAQCGAPGAPPNVHRSGTDNRLVGAPVGGAGDRIRHQAAGAAVFVALCS